MTDKKNHFIVGLILGLLTLPISWQTGLIWAYTITFIGASLTFIGKEIWDTYKPLPTGFSNADLVADYCGLFAGYCLTFLAWGMIQIVGI